MIRVFDISGGKVSRGVSNLGLERVKQRAHSDIFTYLQKHFPIGSTVEFEHGRSVLCGVIVEHCRHDVGLVEVEIQKRGKGGGAYRKTVCPIHSRMLALCRPAKGGE